MRFEAACPSISESTVNAVKPRARKPFPLEPCEHKRQDLQVLRGCFDCFHDPAHALAKNINQNAIRAEKDEKGPEGQNLSKKEQTRDGTTNGQCEG